MNDKFVFANYVASLGKDLVESFQRAKMSTQSVAVGTNKELGVIKKLQDLLPAGVGVGSGFVYDINGNVSNQCDIIIYEKDFCLKACINGNDKDSFYNCESVIAVGEVKSVLTKTELLDSLNKFSRLNKLKRFSAASDLNASRQYLSKMALAESLDDTPVERNEYDRIYKFIVCESMSVDVSKALDERKDTDVDSLFNTIVSLDGRHVVYLSGMKVCLSPRFADMIIIQKDADNYSPFLRFMYHLTHFIINGKTVPLNQSKYYEAETRPINCVEGFKFLDK